MKKHAIGVFITCTRETDLEAEIQKMKGEEDHDK